MPPLSENVWVWKWGEKDPGVWDSGGGSRTVLLGRPWLLWDFLILPGHGTSFWCLLLKSTVRETCNLLFPDLCASPFMMTELGLGWIEEELTLPLNHSNLSYRTYRLGFQVPFSEGTWNPSLCSRKWERSPSSLIYYNLIWVFLMPQGLTWSREKEDVALTTSSFFPLLHLPLEISHSLLNKQQPFYIMACILFLPVVLSINFRPSILKEFENVKILFSLNKPCPSGTHLYRNSKYICAINSIFCPSSAALKPTGSLSGKSQDIMV